MKPKKFSKPKDTNFRRITLLTKYQTKAEAESAVEQLLKEGIPAQWGSSNTEDAAPATQPESFFIYVWDESKEEAQRILNLSEIDLPPAQPERTKDPLHGVTLEMMLNQLVEHYGWEAMGDMVRINCFQNLPSITSSLRFLRKTPWARAKVEKLFLHMVNEKR